MRLGLLIYGSLDTLSGGYLYDRMLVQHLRQAGDEVLLVSLPWRSYGRHLLHNWHAGLLRQLSRLPVDLLLQDELNHPSLFYLNRRLRRRAAYPLVSVVHHLRSSEQHPTLLAWLYRRVEESYLASVDAFICNSQTTRAVVAARLARERPMLVVLPAADHLAASPSGGGAHVAGAAEERLAAKAHEPGPLRLLFVGNLISRKGLHTLLAALARLPADSCRLRVVGRLDVDPAYVAQIRRQLARQGLGSRVALLGRLADRELAAELATAQLLAVPSYEGFGIVYLEAMAHGMPVIASTAGAAHELVQPGQNGLLVAPDDERGLAAALGSLAADRARLARMSLAARRSYLRHPTWAQSMQAVHPFLHSLT